MWVKNLSKFQAIREEQVKFEMAAVERATADNDRTCGEATEEPSLNLKPSREFQSARMLLSHLGFCTPDSAPSKNKQEELSEFMGIDSSDATFFEQLTALDQLPTRTFSSCSIFYVKKNQSNAKAIINNINQNVNLDESFFAFLQSVGSIVEVSCKSGHYSPSTSPKKDQPRDR